MDESLLQDRFILPFLHDTLGYQEVKPNTVSNALVIEEDLAAFVAGSTLNTKAYATLLRAYGGDRKQLLSELVALIQERSASSRNNALFLNSNRSVTLRGVRLHLFYPSDSAIHGDDLFGENIFSVVQELPYIYKVNDQVLYSFRPDLSFFVNGIYLGYSELKSNFMGQRAASNGRSKVVKDYFEAVRAYYETFELNALLNETERTARRRDFLKVFERAIHITATDVGETYVIRNLPDYFDEMLGLCREGRFDRQLIEQKVLKEFKPYPLRRPDAEKADKVKEIFTAHYAKPAIEKEILYYNFIEREVYKVDGVKELKDERGVLIAPRPKQKFGTDKILDKIDEFLAHEGEDDYFLALLEKQLAHVSPDIRKALIDKRRAYSNNKHVYSLLLQYAAGFGKSNIIGWTALQLKDLRRNGEYVYDKIMIVVDRLQLRAQIDSKMLNMNIDKKMFVEAHNKKTFQEALKSDTRIVIVNLQKFGSVRQMLTADVLEKLASLRIAFLIDEIHRSHSGDQHEEMVNIFDELQTPFDADAAYNRKRRKKNVIIGFTATPDHHTLARFGEFSGYAEGEKVWVPFDAYTMQEAIEDGYILNPLANIVPVAAKLLFDLPVNRLRGFTEKDFKDIDRQQIYENRDRIDAIAAYVADLLVKDVYRQIRGAGKAMLAVYSINAAIAYKDAVTRHFQELVKEKRYARYADAPIYIVYSESQDKQKASRLNDGLTEQKVLENFALRKNGLIIVVAKLQTGFDEKRLHTLFLDKEVKDISAIQTISRVNRTMKYKADCKIVDFSYDNVNVQNIKDAFEHFSDVVVSDFDPFGDAKVLDLLYTELKRADVYLEFFPRFVALYNDAEKRDNPAAYLDLEDRMERFIEAHPKRTADIKAKAAQYFTILNRIEYVISLDKKYSEPALLAFYRKFNTLYNTMHRVDTARDPIEVYYDNRIGIVEVEAGETKERKAKTKMAEGREPLTNGRQLSILEIIEARNQHEEQVGALIEEFKAKIDEFFAYVRTSPEGQRLIVKMQSRLPEEEIYADFAKIYRKYKAFYRKKVGDYFFTVTEELVEKLCDEFEGVVVGDSS